VCFVWFSEESAFVSLNGINLLMFQWGRDVFLVGYEIKLAKTSRKLLRDSQSGSSWVPNPSISVLANASIKLLFCSIPLPVPGILEGRKNYNPAETWYGPKIYVRSASCPLLKNFMRN
jgi:hypothetical protein